MIKDHYGAVKGELSLFEVVGGEWRPLLRQANMVTYQGSDAMARMAGGTAQINGVYFVFRNSPAAMPIVADKSNNAATYASIGSSPNRNFVRVPLAADPVYSASSAFYSGNRAVFMAVTDGTSIYLPGVPVVDGTSVFYHVALMCVPDFDEQTDDLVFSCADLATPQTKTAGAQIGLRWTVTFTTP
jgi:hypothetical protein